MTTFGAGSFGFGRGRLPAGLDRGIDQQRERSGAACLQSKIDAVARLLPEPPGAILGSELHGGLNVSAHGALQQPA